MIPFFRKTRKKLADNNKPAKYFRYAIGEIFLVVIGILIALQVNNWNNDRKNRIRENVFVNQLAADLQISITGLDKIHENFQDRAIASGKVVHAFYKPSMQDDFNPRIFSIPWKNQRYIPVTGTAKALVNSGNIDLIRSLELRTAIVEYLETVEALLSDIDRYEESYYRRGINEIDAYFQLSNLTAQYYKENKISYPENMTDYQRLTYPVPEDFEVIPFPVGKDELFQNQRIFHAYSSLLLSHRNTAYQYESMIKATVELFDLIKSKGYEITIKENVNENRDLVFDTTDLLIIQAANSILADELIWHQQDDRSCSDDVANGKYSLFCALYKASIDITGEYVHRRACIQQIRFTLEKYEQGRVINHRLMDWNNHPETTFDEVKKVLKESEEIIILQLNNN